MRVDVKSLETFNRLAHEGAQAATDSLTEMTGIEASVEVTRLTLVSRADLGEELRGDSFAGVSFDLSGGMAGEAVLVFERDSVDPITDALVGGDPSEEMVQSGVEEVGNIMMSGFIDGWADYLETTIEHTPPEYIEREGAAVLPGDGSGDGELFVFTSEIEWVGEPVRFYIYLVPEFDDLADRLSEREPGDGDAIPIDKLRVFREMTTAGTERAAEYVESMTGFGTSAEVTRISFVPVEDVPKQLGTDAYVGTAVELEGSPSGYLLVLFDEPSAVTVAEALVGSGDAASVSDGETVERPSETAEAGATPDGDDLLTPEHEAAIEELGNILSNGFVDGWANVLETTVDHSPPRLVHDMGQAILDPIAAKVGQEQDHAFVVDASMQTDDLAFTSSIHALPHEAELRAALDALDVDRADATEADVDAVFE